MLNEQIFFLQTINYSNMHNEPDLCHNKNSTFCGLNIFAFSWKIICAVVRERNVKEYWGKSTVVIINMSANIIRRQGIQWKLIQISLPNIRNYAILLRWNSLGVLSPNS